MASLPSPLQQIREDLRVGISTPESLLQQALARSDSNANKNVYLAMNREGALQDASDLALRPNLEDAPLFGVPVSLKDCFDLQNFRTTCGSRYYAEHEAIAQSDSAVAAALRKQGALIVGKTNLHPLAYGITGENPEYGDCTQPRNPFWLTGGSSSGAAASVQEGSAIAAIGTDTGGSIRVPAALCGLAGFRASLDRAHRCNLWCGGVHLSPSFDTLGWIFRDLRDGPILAQALFDLTPVPLAPHDLRIGCVAREFLHDADPPILSEFLKFQQQLSDLGARINPTDTSFWEEAMSIFAPIQASEAAAIHSAKTGGDFSHFEKSIAERLAWGASLSTGDLASLRERHRQFRERMEHLLDGCDFFIAPCAPVGRLFAGADHSDARRRILRYTVPMSLGGNPVVTLPLAQGAGVQLIAKPGDDASLLSFAASLFDLAANEIN